MSDQKAEPVFTHTLRRPILNSDGVDITEISFREPRGGDITRCGNPVKYLPFGEAPDISFDEPKMSRMLSALSGVTPVGIDRMHPQDWTECAWGLSRFFIPGLGRETSPPPK